MNKRRNDTEVPQITFNGEVVVPKFSDVGPFSDAAIKDLNATQREYTLNKINREVEHGASQMKLLGRSREQVIIDFTEDIDKAFAKHEGLHT